MFWDSVPHIFQNELKVGVNPVSYLLKLRITLLLAHRLILLIILLWLLIFFEVLVIGKDVVFLSFNHTSHHISALVSAFLDYLVHHLDDIRL